MLNLSLWLYSPSDLGRFFSFSILYTVDRSSWTGISRRKAATYTQNKRTQIPMPRVGFEATIPVFERAKTFHALGRTATGIGM
jgi:hypothetical protein